MSKPILCVDFDGVLHSYTSGWKGADVVADGPVLGAMEWLALAQEHFHVRVYSSRTSQSGGIEAMQSAIERWAYDTGVRLHDVDFPAQKPAAFLTIDDRAVCFEGDFSALDPAKLVAFKPWNKRETAP